MPDLAEVAPDSPPTAQPQRKPPFRFTRDNAREFSAKANAARWSRPQAERDNHASPEVLTAAVPVPDYIARRLERVRAQCDLIDDRITEELSKRQPDGQRLNWLAAASARLEEQEQKLSGRPGPGSRRPAAVGKTMAAAPAPARGPWVPEALPDPAPVVVVAPVIDVPAAPARPMGWEYDG